MIDVAICGLGPTGLLLAHLLGKAGHRVVVLEREPKFYGNARAVYTDDECMRLLQAADVAQEAHAKMLFDVPVQFVRADGSVMGRYAPLNRPFGWPVINFYYQPYLETTLAELLHRHPNVEVRRSRELVEFAQDDDGVTVTHQATREFRFCDENDRRTTADGPLDTQTLRARYLIGADGGRSVVRTMLGVEMTGKNFPEPWLVVDLEQKDRSKGLRHLPYFNFVTDPEQPTVSCVQPDGFHRFEFRLKPGQTKETMEHPDKVRRLLSKWVDPDLFIIKRKLVYTFNALIANRWRHRRVLLAGDAAHMTPQFMGQGASSGFRDAGNLAWKLDFVLRGLASPALLDTYEQERRPHAQAMIDTSVLMKDAVSTTHPIWTVVRDSALHAAQSVPQLKAWLTEGGFKPKPMYADGTYFGRPRSSRNAAEGKLSPQPEVLGIDRRRVLLDDVTGPGFALIGFRVDPRATLSPSALATVAKLGMRCVTVFRYGERPQGLRDVARSRPDGLVEIEELRGEVGGWFREAGLGNGAVALLRPDKFTYAMVPAQHAGASIAMLANSLMGDRNGA